MTYVAGSVCPHFVSKLMSSIHKKKSLHEHLHMSALRRFLKLLRLARLTFFFEIANK